MANNELFDKISDIIYKNDLEGFKKIIDTMSNANEQNKHGESALHLAIRRNRTDMIKYLVEDKNADINIKDAAGWTPLMEAVVDNFPEVVKYLMEKGADKSIPNGRGEGAPKLAQKFGRSSMFEYLL